MEVGPGGEKRPMSVGSLTAKGRRAARSDWVEWLGRAGLASQGVLWCVIGVLAAKIALGAREEHPDRQGALHEIAQQPLGRVLLVVLAVGFAGYAVWRLSEAIFDRDGEGKGVKGLGKRGSALARAFWYGSLSALAVAKVLGADEKSGSEAKTTDGVLALPLGRWIVVAVGLACLGVGIFNAYRAVTCKFEKKLKKSEMNDAEEAGATGLGLVGYLARGIVFSLVGLFFLKAAWEYDAKEARGLDGALLELAQAPYGGWLLGAVAVGLVAFGFYCFVQAAYRRI